MLWPFLKNLAQQCRKGIDFPEWTWYNNCVLREDAEHVGV